MKIGMPFARELWDATCLPGFQVLQASYSHSTSPSPLCDVIIIVNLLAIFECWKISSNFLRTT